MAQIILTNIQKEISGQKLFTIKHLQARQAARIGIVGKNGGGKTTLLRMLTGKDTYYDGEIDLTGSCYLVPQLKENTTQSGGEQVRAYLNQALKARPEILLLDEPSANLDRANQEWLINKLKRYPGIIVFVTHDRHLLTELATSIWEIENQVYTEYPVNYQTYLEQKEKYIEKKEQAFVQYTQEKKKLEAEIQKRKIKADRMRKPPKGMSSSEARAMSLVGNFDGKQRKMAATAKSLEHRKESLSEVEKVKKAKTIQLVDQGLPQFNGKTIMRITALDLKVADRLLLKNATFHWSDGERLALIGPNRSGKTTLIKKLLVNDSPEIYVSEKAKIGYFSQDFQTIEMQKTIFDNAKQFSTQPDQVIFDILGAMGFRQEKVLQLADSLSGGERVRLGLVQILVSDSNVLILDEPTNYLDIQALEALERFLNAYQGGVLIVSHDKAFIDQVATRELVIQSKELLDTTKLNHSSAETAELESKLQLLMMRKNEWIADMEIPIEKIQQINQEIAEVKKQLDER